MPRAIVLVEGTSDQLAVEALAARLGRNLDAEGVAVVPIGGAQAIGRVLARYGPQGLGVTVAGLVDAAEEAHFRRALERVGLGSELARVDMEAVGFYVCDRDLEDELTRAVGADGVEQIIEAQGELESFRTFQKQLEKRELTREAQLHGFMWNRKIRYAPLLVEALDLTQVPRPLDRVLAHVLLPEPRVRIRAARTDEGLDLTELAMRAKSHWGYDDEFLVVARANLTIDADRIGSSRMYVLEEDGAVIGFYGLVGDPPEGWLEWMFLEPASIGRGYGRLMWDEAMKLAEQAGFTALRIESDRYAEPFYLAMGAVRIGSNPSPVDGAPLPILKVDVG